MAQNAAAEPSRQRAPFVVLGAAAALYAATFATLGFLQYRAGNITYTDTANFEEMLWRTLHGRVLMCSAWPYSFLGEHVQVVHLLLLPAYIFLPDLRTLMAAQTVALAAGAFPVYALAVHVLKSRWCGCALGVAYLLYTPMQMLNLEGGGAFNTFRPITFSVPLLLAAFYFLVRDRLVLFSVFAFLALLCKEEFGLIVFMLGLYAAWLRKRRAFGLAWSAAGLLWFALSLGVVMPAVRGGPSHTVSYYSHFGDTAGEIIASVLLHPLRALRYALLGDHPDVNKLEFFHILFLPVGFVCLLSPATLALALPTFALCLLSHRYASWMPWFHYHAPIVPFVFIATVYGLRNLARLLQRWRTTQEPTTRRAVLGGSLFVLACALGTNVAYSKSPLSFHFYDPESLAYYRTLYVATPRARRIPEVVRSVPREAAVSASLFLATYFTHHAAVLVFPDGVEEGHWRAASHVVLDLGERWLFNAPGQRACYERLLDDPAFERVPAPEGFVILRRRPAQDGR